MRLVFVLYAEDRDLLPSRSDGRAREIYETSYSVRGLYATLVEDAALNPDTMDERRGGWGRLLALFRLIHKGHRTGFVQARGGKLFDPDEFPFLEGRATKEEPGRILTVSDGCLLRVLEGLMTLKVRGGDRERLSYRALDVEQIGSVYETVMGFTVEAASGRVLAIKAGKNNHTPVFVALDELLGQKGKDRIKDLRENAGRGQISAAQAKAIETATSADELAAALDSIVDERGSPRHAVAPAGSPILQPTNERRRTGSHYTPRSLTAPIVLNALEPAFERLGLDATPEQVLDLKVCDPAMGSGAFLVEVCRVIGERLVEAWDRWPKTRPTIPADEDEELHARRLVAQRCLYGVDKNARAVDLARLSLWLATLARDHEFTFLDHALKCGDSLVGLTREQITSLHWDADGGLPLFSALVRESIAAAVGGRREIREAPDDVSRAIQEVRYRTVEGRLDSVRLIGNAIVAAFFSADKARARERQRQEIESWANGPAVEMWPKLQNLAYRMHLSSHPMAPFHWEIEFPEVFARENGGFDAVVGNPPFLGGKRISAELGEAYADWLQELHRDAHGNADLVTHFFRRGFSLLREGCCFGLLATNTISQGDTRESGLRPLLASNGTILRATRRLPWPGEAAVIVSVVHLMKGRASRPILDGRQVRRISAYLVEGELDASPVPLSKNSGVAFNGCVLMGLRFTFDDENAARGKSNSVSEMHKLIERQPRNAARIFPYIGGEEVSSDPRHSYRRWAIDFNDFPLRREHQKKPWNSMVLQERAAARAQGIVPLDYTDEVAADWPDLLEIVEQRVKPERHSQKRKAIRERWWQYADKRPGLRRAITGLESVLAITQTSPHLAISRLSNGMIYDQKLVIVADETLVSFANLQARPHELWARTFAATMKDDLSYTQSDCFQTYPFPATSEASSAVEMAGQAYHDYRAALMVARKEGMTRTYNRFHDWNEHAEDINRLRELHAEMDYAVLEAYGWHDLAQRAAPCFLDETNEDDHAYQGRLFWPSDFRDEVLARLLALNAERAAAERAAGLVVLHEDSEDEIGEEAETEEA